MIRKPWSPREMSRLNEMRERKCSSYEIARALGRSRSSVRSKIDYAVMVKRPAEEQFRPDPAILAERDYRLSINHTDLTAFMFGDPVPGRGQSALERRAG